MSPLPSLAQVFQAQLETLATVLLPATIRYYRSAVNRFLRFLGAAYPEVRTAAQLRRDPHMVGWLRSLGQEIPPLSTRTRGACLMCVRRLLEDLAANGHPLAEGLLLRQDFPPRDLYLPQPLSPEIDRLLDEQLRRTDDLCAHALRLLRATGLRIGECLRLRTDCLRHLGAEDWAIHVPLGKLHSERWVPVDDEIRHTVDRILALRGTTQPRQADHRADWLLVWPDGRRVSYPHMRKALDEAAHRAGCPVSIRPHQLRHTYASQMLRAGVSLPAVKELLGHRDIRMTMVYIQVTQNDLQQQYHQAIQHIARRHTLLPLPALAATATNPALPAICQSLAATCHVLEMYRRQLADHRAQRKIHQLARRITKIAAQLEQLAPAAK